MSKEFKDMTYEEMVDEATGVVLHAILGGTKLRSAIWQAIQHAAMWHKAVNPPPKLKRWRVMVDISTKPNILAAVYIDAGKVIKTSHDRISADGVDIELPGKVGRIRIVSKV